MKTRSISTQINPLLHWCAADGYCRCFVISQAGLPDFYSGHDLPKLSWLECVRVETTLLHTHRVKQGLEHGIFWYLKEGKLKSKLRPYLNGQRQSTKFNSNQNCPIRKCRKDCWYSTKYSRRSKQDLASLDDYHFHLPQITFILVKPTQQK